MNSGTVPRQAAPGGTATATYVLEEQVGFILRQVSQRHALIFSAHICDDLTPTQFSAMMKLHDHGSLSQNLLGRMTAMDIATIKGVIDRLMGRRYIIAGPDTEDGRLRVLRLTRQGQAVAKRAIACAGEITEKTLAPLNGAERAVLLNLLRRLT